LTGERFQQVKQSQNALTQAALENHFGWAEAVRDWPLLQQLDMRQQSSILYDAVAVYLAFSDAFLEMESLPIVVTSDGKTLIDPAGKLVSCATEWRDQEAFLDLLVARLL
jgi:hypothetical protein